MSLGFKQDEPLAIVGTARIEIVFSQGLGIAKGGGIVIKANIFHKIMRADFFIKEYIDVGLINLSCDVNAFGILLAHILDSSPQARIIISRFVAVEAAHIVLRENAEIENEKKREQGGEFPQE